MDAGRVGPRHRPQPADRVLGHPGRAAGVHRERATAGSSSSRRSPGRSSAIPGSAVYGAAKAGVLGLMRGLAIEVGRERRHRQRASCPAGSPRARSCRRRRSAARTRRSAGPARPPRSPRSSPSSPPTRRATSPARGSSSTAATRSRSSRARRRRGTDGHVRRPRRADHRRASGIGLATGRRLGRDGFRLVLADIDAAGLDRAVARARGPDRALGVATDVRSFAAASAQSPPRSTGSAGSTSSSIAPASGSRARPTR